MYPVIIVAIVSITLPVFLDLLVMRKTKVNLNMSSVSTTT
jgi:hypothetical protein